MGIIVSLGQSLTTEGNVHPAAELLPLTSTEEHNGREDRGTYTESRSLISHSWKICIQQLHSYYESEEAWLLCESLCVLVCVQSSQGYFFFCVLSYYCRVRGAGSDEEPRSGRRSASSGFLCRVHLKDRARCRRRGLVPCTYTSLALSTARSTSGLWVQIKAWNKHTGAESVSHDTLRQDRHLSSPGRTRKCATFAPQTDEKNKWAKMHETETRNIYLKQRQRT